jgi:hypothetical protein
MKGLHIVPGGPTLKVAFAILFRLHGAHGIMDAGDTVYQAAAAILESCAHHGDAEDFDDAASTVDGLALNVTLDEQRRDIFDWAGSGSMDQFWVVCR